jgi:hypothetical protein
MRFAERRGLESASGASQRGPPVVFILRAMKKARRTPKVVSMFERTVLGPLQRGGKQMILENLQISYRAVRDLIPYARNPRKNDQAVDRMVAAIREYGFAIPLLVRQGGEVVDWTCPHF